MKINRSKIRRIVNQTAMNYAARPLKYLKQYELTHFITVCYYLGVQLVMDDYGQLFFEPIKV